VVNTSVYDDKGIRVVDTGQSHLAFLTSPNREAR
jgi:hypothetical protein